MTDILKNIEETISRLETRAYVTTRIYGQGTADLDILAVNTIRELQAEVSRLETHSSTKGE